MKYFSLFTGIGGFELGIQQAYESKVSIWNGATKNTKSESFKQSVEPTTESILSNRYLSDPEFRGDTGEILCIGYSEIDKYATQIYQKHFPEHKNYGDITKINTEDLPDFELLVGGFPCQSFSIAGKRGGFADTRGTLFFEIARIAREKQPRLLLLENVKGLLSHDQGNTFYTIISTLDELGYDLQWQVLNSKNFGVPQNRERVFIVGHLRGTSRPEVFPFAGGNSIGIKELTSKASQGYRLYDTSGINITLASQAGGVGAKTGLIAPTIRATEYKHGDNQTTVAEDGMKIRRLTPKECERLQGFPDNWTEGVSDTQRYKCLGNAVTVNVIQAIIQSL